MDPSSPAANGLVIAGYFVNWGIYAREHNVIDMAADAHKLTHLLYAFANVQDDGTIVLGDAWADKDKHFPAEQTIDGNEDTWDEEHHHLYGNLKQLYLLKQRNRHLKVTLSVGGWSWSTHFPAVAADPAARARFVETSVQHVADLGLDGIDVDWEFPKSPEEASDFVLLLNELRTGLDEYQQRLGQTDQPRFLLTLAVSCARSTYELLPLQEMEPNVDLFYLMAYDLAGAWDPHTGHQAALYGDGLCVHQAVQDYLDGGVPPHKIVMGLPVYGRGYCDTDGPHCCFNDTPEGTWEKGTFDYKHLPKEGASEHHDWGRMASWSYDPETREYITYDSPSIIQAKCDYIKEKGLGGAMFWELSADHKGDHPRSLLNTVYNAFEGNLDTVPNHLEYPESQYENIRDMS